LEKKELIAITALLAFGFLLLFLRSEEASGQYAQITSQTETYTFNLGTNKTFYLPSNPDVIFQIEEGQIAFIKSNCPDQICVRTGFQRYAGQIAACLPNHMILTIKSQIDSETVNSEIIDIFTH